MKSVILETANRDKGYIILEKLTINRLIYCLGINLKTIGD